MIVPFLGKRNESRRKAKRAGGGGGGRGGGSSSSSSSGKGSSSSSSSGKGSSSGSQGKGSSSSLPNKGSSSSTSGRSSRSITPYGNGAAKSFTIPSGQPFAGRTAGGATRDQIYGTRTYGSGYPNNAGSLGVANRGFPFFFWPVVWGGTAGGTAAYLHDQNEYPNNSSRPGGILMTAAFQSNSTSSIYRILADNTTVSDLITDIHANCSSHLTSNSASSPSNAIVYNSSASDAPKPEQVVQYFRASTVALTLDGYNNTSVFSDSNSTADVALPSGIDTTLLDCMNSTIGVAVPLIDGASMRWGTPTYGVVGLVWVMMFLMNFS
ncbi:hypothetical protein F5878DRAFT_588318 [Lentinula raphanica]|uniref:Uncharacterized protein n=1 Tax=Lentinula raphanica TaxID=153919 RepID=A0AA38UA14_9AGAR|nr:hypothetical protein F5878DRAFT_588318 [Lentinula raphanica]